jgi:hypothetical protein
MLALKSFLPESKLGLYVLLAGTVLLGVFVLHQWNHPLRKYPAPNVFVTIPYLGEIWFAWVTLKGDPDWTLRELHRRLGKVVRIGPNEVSIDDSDAVKDLYGHGNDIEKGITPPELGVDGSVALLGFRGLQLDHVFVDGRVPARADS